MRRRDLLVLVLGLSACGRAKPDEPGGQREREPEPRSDPTPPKPEHPGPIGSLDEVPEILRPAFDPAAHAPAPADLPTDGERPQTYANFWAEHPPRPRPGARTIAILPIGEYPRGFIVEYDTARLVRSPEPALLARFVEAWFGLPTRVLPALPDELLESTFAIRERDGRRQLDAGAILEWLRTRRPDDACCVLALTLEDLHDGDADTEWVFGYASIAARVGVHSMLRYDPGFENTDLRGPKFERAILLRALRVLAHEVGHMFGLRHCVHYACIQNPTAGLEDLDRLPLHLCPVCLRKLWSVTGLGLADRWRQLASLGDELELDAEAAWYRARLGALGTSLGPATEGSVSHE